MTISTEVRKAGPFIGNDSASVFPFAFKVFKAADLIVVRRQDNIGTETTLVLDSDYHVALNSNQDTTPGGVVTLVAGALASGFTLVVSSELPYLQPTDLTNQGGFYPKVITNALDRLTIFCQQLAEITGRTLKLPITAPTNISAEIPLPNPSELIAWNETGTGLTTVSPQSLVTSIAYGSATADLFAGDGISTTFPLSTNPASVNNLDVSIGGHSQRPVQGGVGDYSWNGGASITFVVPPPAPTVPGDKNVLVRYMQAIPVSDSETLHAQTREALRRSYAEAGYTLVAGSFETGGTLTAATDVLLQESTGAIYAWTGSFPKVVAPGFDPVGVVGFELRTDVLLRSEIGGADGSSLVSHTNSISAVTKPIKSLLAKSLCIDDFIPPGVLPSADHTIYVQKAFKDAFAAGCSLHGATGMTYNISATILVPQNFDSTFYKAGDAAFDGNGCVFNMLIDVTLFESAYLNGSDTLVSNFGTALDSHYSTRITFGNFTVQTTNVSGVLHSALLRIQDWHQGCKLHDISSSCSSWGLYSANNYYTEFDNLVFSIPGAKTGTKFIFSGSHNLNILRRLVATNADIQYRFDGPVTALVMDGCSFEGATVGAQFNAAVYDLSIENCYMENISDVVLFFADYFYNCKASNNYINFIDNPSMYFMGYVDTPVTGMDIDASNHFASMPDESHIIKTKSTSYGIGITIRKRDYQESDHRGLIVDSSTYGERVRIEQEARFVGYRGRKVRGHLVGNYAGKFTEGSGVASGFTWLPSGSFPRVLEIKTSIIHNLTELAYINIFVAYSGGVTNVSGFFVGGHFYKFTAGGVVPSSDLSIVTGIDGEYVRLQSPSDFTPSAITAVTGEIRII